MRQFEKNIHTKLLHQHPYRVCVRCIMDTSDPQITFNEAGVCNHCIQFDQHETRLGDASNRAAALNRLVTELKDTGIGKSYDCVMGLSGGIDSSFLAHFAVKVLKLRPLVVHIDSGWNSELAVRNIENTCKLLQIDLHTLVIEWNEMRDLQRAYFRSGIANLDVPQDHAFEAALISEARKYGINHILNGGNMQTECTMPLAWGYDASDSLNLREIHRRFGQDRLKSYPVRGFWQKYLIDRRIRKIHVHRPLEYIPYNKAAAKALLERELNWKDYGGKHFESKFTKFFQAYYLPEKFGYDKRKAHLSSLIVSGQMSRDDALLEISKSRYNESELIEDIDYFCKKLGITRMEFQQIMQDRPRFYSDFKNSERRVAQLRSVLLRSNRVMGWRK